MATTRSSLNIKLQNVIEFPTCAEVTLDVTLYNPRTSKVASLYHGVTEVDQEEDRASAHDRCRVYDNLAFWVFSVTFVVFCFAYGGICLSH